MKDRSSGAQVGAEGAVRARILAVAKELFLRNGFLQTTVNVIVAEAKTSKREFYKYFADRESLFLEIVRNLLNSGNAIRHIPEADLKDLLPKLATDIYLSNMKLENLGLFRASIVASARSPDLDRTVHEYRMQASLPLARRFAEYQGKGELTFDDPLLAALRFGFVAVDGLRFAMGGPALDERGRLLLARQASDLFLNGVGTESFRANPEGFRLTGEVRLPAHATEDAQGGGVTRLSPDAWDNVHEIAWAEFAQHGFAASSLERIARKAKIARTTIYRQYPTKQEFFLASARRIVDRIYGQEIVIPGGGLTAQDALHFLGRTILDRFLTPDNLALHKMLIAEGGNSPELTFPVYSHLCSMMISQIDVMIRLFSNMEVINDFHINEVSWKLFILLSFGGRMIFFVPASEDEKDRLIGEAIRLFLFGCGTRLKGEKPAAAAACRY